jgi:hypothetical protein
MYCLAIGTANLIRGAATTAASGLESKAFTDAYRAALEALEGAAPERNVAAGKRTVVGGDGPQK